MSKRKKERKKMNSLEHIIHSIPQEKKNFNYAACGGSTTVISFDNIVKNRIEESKKREQEVKTEQAETKKYKLLYDSMVAFGKNSRRKHNKTNHRLTKHVARLQKDALLRQLKAFFEVKYFFERVNRALDAHKALKDKLAAEKKNYGGSGTVTEMIKILLGAGVFWMACATYPFYA